MPTEFINWFKSLEDSLVKQEPKDSKINGEYLYVKYYPEFTQVFDKNNQLIFDEPIKFNDCDIDCLIELSSVYSYKGKYGLVCKLYQARIIPCGNLFTFVED